MYTYRHCINCDFHQHDKSHTPYTYANTLIHTHTLIYIYYIHLYIYYRNDRRVRDKSFGLYTLMVANYYRHDGIIYILYEFTLALQAHPGIRALSYYIIFFPSRLSRSNPFTAAAVAAPGRNPFQPARAQLSPDRKRTHGLLLLYYYYYYFVIAFPGRVVSAIYKHLGRAVLFQSVIYASGTPREYVHAHTGLRQTVVA